MAAETLKSGYCIVTGGHNKKPAPDQSGTCQVLDPARHGPNVNADDLPFITMLRSPTMHEQECTSFPPEPGTAVFCEWTTGLPTTRRFVGMPNETNNSQAVGGNFDIMSAFPDLAKAVQEKTGKITSKGFQNGGKVRPPKDGDEWAHTLSKGLPTHAALYPLAGTIIPALKSIDTATKQFASILSSSMLSQLPGQVMSLANLFGGMSSKQKARAKQNMPREVADAFESMINLMQTGDAGGDYLTGARVNEEVFRENAIDMLSQCSNLSDLVHCMGRIQRDESLRGLELLPAVEIVSDSGGFGDFVFNLDASGNLSYANTSPTEAANFGGGGGGGNKNQAAFDAIKKFGDMLQSGALNPGTNSGENLFKDYAQKMSELQSRLPTQMSSFFKSVIEKTASNPFQIEDATKLVKDQVANLGGYVKYLDKIT